jgi:hypothetical protein
MRQFLVVSSTAPLLSMVLEQVHRFAPKLACAEESRWKPERAISRTDGLAIFDIGSGPVVLPPALTRAPRITFWEFHEFAG